ncbi:MAG: DUF3050 domain-containing protein [Candidatus Kapabacteria bacterium]|nr:DUF3050 domain-containing protein [Candidatus Kapabacteria bacterium]
MQSEKLISATEDLRAVLGQHRLYNTLTSVGGVARFMEHHVFAVWDFMTLLKALQRGLTCVDVPWVPRGNAETRYLINEIVVGEESDVDRNGVRMSHFEMYCQAMKGLGASTGPIDELVGAISQGVGVETALSACGAPQASAEFVRSTLDVVMNGALHEIAAVFTFGREDVIPTMFLGMLDHIPTDHASAFDDLRYYLQRHIDVDGDHHGPLALAMVEHLIDNDQRKYDEALFAARSALQHRIMLWDAVADSLSSGS